MVFRRQLDKKDGFLKAREKRFMIKQVVDAADMIIAFTSAWEITKEEKI